MVDTPFLRSACMTREPPEIDKTVKNPVPFLQDFYGRPFFRKRSTPFPPSGSSVLPRGMAGCWSQPLAILGSSTIGESIACRASVARLAIQLLTHGVAVGLPAVAPDGA